VLFFQFWSGDLSCMLGSTGSVLFFTSDIVNRCTESVIESAC